MAAIGRSQRLAPSTAPTFRAEALLTAPGSVIASIRVQVLRSGDIVVVPLQKIPDGPGKADGFLGLAA